MADKQITPFQLTDQFTMDNFNQRINETNIALQKMVNPNLLDNWYFVNPVNQRGQTSYTGAGYGIDRWITDIDAGGGITITDNGIVIASAGTYWGTRLDNIARLSGKTVTGSVLMSNGTLYSGTIESVKWQMDAAQIIFSNTDTTFYINKTGDDKAQVEISTGRAGVEILAAKLELGNTQTLAHQENGNWVLNEIPDYGEQLARCQRYFRRIKAKQVYSSGVMFSFPIVDVGGATWANINVILSTMMRDAKPSVSFHGLSVADYVSTQSRGSISDNAERNVIYYTGDTVKLSINTGITLTDTDAIMMASEGYIDIINDL